MAFKIKIKRICVRPRDFEIDAKVSGKNLDRSVAFDKKYYLTFNTGLGWSPYEAVRKIASHMAEQTGKARKVFGRVIRDEMLQITEEQFEKRIYYLWNFCKYDYRIGERGVFRIDNLVKGAAGQAVQNMNIMMGLDETAGLGNIPFPV